LKEIFKTIKALKSSFGVFAAQSVLINLRQEIYEIHVPDEINNKKKWNKK
jgi:hypothetical protein